ncbi:MAG: hypothetical protein WA004_07480 [Saprospiraceae bacterium]
MLGEPAFRERAACFQQEVNRAEERNLAVEELERMLKKELVGV